jgi:hypothetical protein
VAFKFGWQNITSEAKHFTSDNNYDLKRIVDHSIANHTRQPQVVGTTWGHQWFTGAWEFPTISLPYRGFPFFSFQNFQISSDLPQ